MDIGRLDGLREAVKGRLSRRTALGRLAGGGAAVAVLGALGPARAAAQAATPMAAPVGWRAEHLELEFTPTNPISITLAGGGPPQRGDHFFVDAAIYAAGDVNGKRIGTYQCFGVWTAAATATDAPNQRLTTLQFHLDDGSAIMGIINEGGKEPNAHVGPVQGGTGRYASAHGTFHQVTEQGPVAGVIATPGAAGTPGPGQFVVRAVFDLVLPQGT